MQDQFETIRQAELERIRGRLGKITPEQEQAIEALSRAIVNKILHTPIRSLKSAAASPEMTTLVESFRRIFDLQVKVVPTGEGGCTPSERDQFEAES